jgi:exopolysaccharide biosynthesis polyprenyl glycosylphosphotransferase
MTQRHGASLTSIVDSAIALAIAVFAVIWANEGRMPPGGSREFLEVRITLLNASFSVVFVVLWKQCLEALGLYGRSFAGLLRHILLVGLGCALMTAVLGFYLKWHQAKGPIPRVLAAFFILSVTYELTRVLVFTRPLQWTITGRQQVVILGSGPRACKAWRELRTHHHSAREVLGFFDDRDSSEMAPDVADRYLGRVDALPAYLLHHIVDELVIAAPMRSCYEVTQRAISTAEAAGVHVVCMNDPYHLTHGRKLRERATLFLELLARDTPSMLGETIKRAVDVILAALLLVLLAPLMVLIGITVKLTSPGSVFFWQERHGYRRRTFRMCKFRSMVRDASHLMANLEAQNEASGPIFKIREDPRITPLGRFLRRTSLDELPQLWNVLLGDMSLVGPRPMSTRDVSLFSDAQLLRRFSVRPGITGMWQITGRSSLNFDDWIALDFSYIDQWSLLLDLSILCRTLPAVLRRSGAV